MRSTTVTSKVRNVLYATDFSRTSDAALHFASAIARRYGAKIFVAHVVSLSPLPNSSMLMSQELAAQGVREAHKSMERLEARWNEIPHEQLIRKGDIWIELSKIIVDKQIDLIVAGTHGRTGMEKILMGSIADKIYRYAPCPVLTVGPNVDSEPESVGNIHAILCPMEFGPESLFALSYAISVAQEYQARLCLLHVTERPVGGSIRDELIRRLQNLIPLEARLSCAPKAIIESGTPAEKISETAKELAVDLVVMGPKRKEILPGSSHLPWTTMCEVINRASCPVLTVHECTSKGVALRPSTTQALIW